MAEMNEIGFIAKINEIYSKFNIIVRASEGYNDKIIETLKNLSQTKKQELLELNTKEKEFLVISQKETSLVENLKNLELKSKEFSEIIFSEEEFNLVQNNYKDLELKAKNYNIILWEVSQKPVILEYLNNSWNLILQIDENIKTLKNDLQKLNYQEEDYLKIKQKYDEINFVNIRQEKKKSEKLALNAWHG